MKKKENRFAVLGRIIWLYAKYQFLTKGLLSHALCKPRVSLNRCEFYHISDEGVSNTEFYYGCGV